MINLIKFKISKTEHLKINPECIHDDDCQVCAKIDIDYVDENKNLCLRLGNEALSDFCYKITESGRIQKLIDGKMLIKHSVNTDLGFEWNQYFEGKIQDTDVDKYHCWTNNQQKNNSYSCWLYNDQKGNIIFEITPFYPWHGETKKSHPDFITYKKFMKNYKPTLKTIIPKKNLKQWIVQARELEKKYFSEFEKS